MRTMFAEKKHHNKFFPEKAGLETKMVHWLMNPFLD